MEKEAKTHSVARNRTAVAGSRATPFTQRESIWVPQIQSSQRKMMFSVYSYDIISIIKMSLESLCLQECHHYGIRHMSLNLVSVLWTAQGSLSAFFHLSQAHSVSARNSDDYS